MKRKRKIPLVVISDVHLGTYGCHAKELLQYLKSINPQTLCFKRRHHRHVEFQQNVISLLPIWKFCATLSKCPTREPAWFTLPEITTKPCGNTLILSSGNLELVDKLILDLDGKKTWIFHGDVFDSSTKGYAKILAKLGGKGYDLLILINSLINWILVALGREKRSFSKTIKNSVKKAVAFLSNFETTAAEIAIEKKYSYVVCGHIHMPQKKNSKNETRKGYVPQQWRLD